MQRMHVVTLLTLVFVSLFPATGSAATAPHIFYSDLQSGPNSGGQNNQGVFVTIFGVGFGTSQGNSQVTIGGGTAANYPSWSDSKIVFQLGPNASTGNIVVHIGGSKTKSNGIRFTVRSGNIYFVSPNGNDAASGAYSAPWKTPAPIHSTVTAGDTIYLLDGLQFISTDANDAAFAVSQGGLNRAPIALVAYPGANVNIGSATAGSYGIYAAGAPFWVVSGIHILGFAEALHLSASNSWRIVANDISCPNANSTGGCLDGTNAANTTILGNKIHDSGAAGTALAQYDAIVLTASNGVEIGWNEIARTNACNAIHGLNKKNLLTNFSIHDNWIHDSVCSAILLPGINASQIATQIFNNLIARAGTGPSPGPNAIFACVSVAGSGTVQIENNTLHDCGATSGSQSGALDVSVPVSFIDNLVDLASGENYLSTASVVANLAGSNDLFNGAGSPPASITSAVNSDPQFVDPSQDNYQLQSSSPAIDAGTSTGNTPDILGTPRPQGNAYDIGAYEFNGTANPGAPSAQVQASPTALNFGSVNDGSTSTLTVTLTNTGLTPATILQAIVNGAGFSSPGVPAGTTIAAGATLPVQVSFAPTSATSFSGTLTITSDATNPSLTVNLSGSGQALQATISAAPATVAFGSVNTGATANQTITLTNTGNGSASITQVSASGTGFSVSGTPAMPYTLAAGATVSFSVNFAPTSVTSYSGSVTVTSNASNTTLSVPLSGTGTQPPQAMLAANPASIAFGSVNTGSSSTQSVTVTNSGNAGATINQITAIGTGFSISNAPAMPYTLAAGATLSLSVTFAPTTVTSYSGTLALSSNASNATLSVPLSGTGTKPPQATLAANPANVNFGSVNTGTTGTQTVTITNSGNASASISQISASGTGFSTSGIPTMPYTLAAGATVSFSVTFAPTTVTSYSGSLVVNSNSSNSTLSVPLSGTGTQPPQAKLAASPTSVNFGSANTGTSTNQSVTITNSGNASATISQVSEAGAGFTISGITTPYTLAASSSVTLTITFSPTATTSYSGTMTVTSNASNSTLTVPLSGTGSQAPQAQIGASPSAVTFGSVSAANTAQQSITLQNTGNTSASISQLSTTGTGFSIGGITLPYTLAAGASVAVQVTFSPATAGSYSGTAVVTSNAANSPLSIPLTGTGAHSVGVSWTDGSSGLSGYNVYRSTTTGGPYTKQNSSLIPSLNWNDDAVQNSQTYFYVVTAVDTSGKESGFSSEVSATIPNQ